MLKLEDPIRKLAAVAGIALIAAAEAFAQEKARPSRRIIVSIPDRKLVLIQDGYLVKVYDTAVGASRSPSPRGSFQIVNQIQDPTWYTKGRIVRPGKANPLGTRWMGLSLKGYGIHGTNRPSSIGRASSHGCIRMRNHDVEELFGLVSPGDVVELAGERTPELDRIFGESAAQSAPATVRAGADVR